MTILVRNALSAEFLDGNGGWTKDLQGARNFENTRQAIEAAAKFNASQLELLLFFEDPLLTVPIPLRITPASRPKGFARMTGEEAEEHQTVETGMDVMVRMTSDVRHGHQPRVITEGNKDKEGTKL
jgi:hypothetical protein